MTRNTISVRGGAMPKTTAWKAVKSSVRNSAISAEAEPIRTIATLADIIATQTPDGRVQH
jgi:hypothetical protein